MKIINKTNSNLFVAAIPPRGKVLAPNAESPEFSIMKLPSSLMKLVNNGSISIDLNNDEHKFMEFAVGSYGAKPIDYSNAGWVDEIEPNDGIIEDTPDMSVEPEVALDSVVAVDAPVELLDAVEPEVAPVEPEVEPVDTKKAKPKAQRKPRAKAEPKVDNDVSLADLKAENDK